MPGIFLGLKFLACVFFWVCNMKLRRTPPSNGAYHLKFGFLLLFSVDERLKLGNRANGKKLSDVPFRTEKEDYLWS